MAHGDHLKYQAKPKAGRQTLFRLTSYLVCDRLLLSVIGVLIVLSIAANLGGSYLLRPIINRYIIPGDFLGLGKMLGILIGVYLTGVLAVYVEYRLLNKIGQRTVARMREDLFLELENSENGEYETEVEKGGEVALEQFHITRLILPAFNVRVGHVIVPVGLTNTHHEPINFFGTSRPEGETSILPSTWHETGIEFYGTFGRWYSRFSYQALVVAGLNPNGFDRDTWVAGGKQGLFETDNFTSPAYVGRLNYERVLGLRIGGSVYYCADAARNADKKQTYSSIGDA